MKARALVGKRIKRVIQYFWKDGNVPGWCIEAIEFTDGSWLRFNVTEGEGEYGIEAIYPANLARVPQRRDPNERT